MNDQLSKIDHLAIIVDDIEKSVDYYSKRFKCDVSYKDSTWAMLKFDNINLALVTQDEHPNHFAIVDHSIVNDKISCICFKCLLDCLSLVWFGLVWLSLVWLSFFSLVNLVW